MSVGKGSALADFNPSHFGGNVADPNREQEADYRDATEMSLPNADSPLLTPELFVTSSLRHRLHLLFERHQFFYE
ncbi:MAG: hypothetical protein ACF788_07025 [Novipirellula sp. JB048]